MVNQALDINDNVFTYPTGADTLINVNGSNWYWAATSVFAISTLIFAGLSFTVPSKNRMFHYIVAAISLTATISYFSMASNLGYAAIQVEFVRDGVTVAGQLRQVFYVRYIDWFVTGPLILLALLFTAGAPVATILYTIFLDEVVVITALVGALTESSYKWGYFTFGMVSLIAVAYNLLFVARKYAAAAGADISKVFLMTSGWIVFIWFIYPISWGISEGGNVIGSDGEAIFYGILDIMSKVVFGAILLFGHRNIDPARLGLAIRDPTDAIVVEKAAASAAAEPAVTA